MLDGTELESLSKGLQDNNLLSQTTHLLTGYIGSPSFLLAVSHVVSTLRIQNPDLKYVCDPVLGDNGRLYVPEELIDLYIKNIVPLAYMLTPNSFEIEMLTKIKVVSLSTAIRACNKLHEMGPEIVVITSMKIEENSLRYLCEQACAL